MCQLLMVRSTIGSACQSKDNSYRFPSVTYLIISTWSCVWIFAIMYFISTYKTDSDFTLSSLEILSVSPESGGRVGGADITIIGDFFQYPTEVIAAGMEISLFSPVS